MIDSENEDDLDGSVASLLSEHSDDLYNFQSYCSFFFDAIKAMAYQDQPMDHETAEGIAFFTGWMKQRLENINERALKMHELTKNADLA